MSLRPSTRRTVATSIPAARSLRQVSAISRRRSSCRSAPTPIISPHVMCEPVTTSTSTDPSSVIRSRRPSEDQKPRTRSVIRDRRFFSNRCGSRSVRSRWRNDERGLDQPRLRCPDLGPIPLGPPTRHRRYGRSRRDRRPRSEAYGRARVVGEPLRVRLLRDARHLPQRRRDRRLHRLISHPGPGHRNEPHRSAAIVGRHETQPRHGADRAREGREGRLDFGRSRPSRMRARTHRRRLGSQRSRDRWYRRRRSRRTGGASPRSRRRAFNLRSTDPGLSTAESVRSPTVPGCSRTELPADPASST